LVRLIGEAVYAVVLPALKCSKTSVEAVEIDERLGTNTQMARDDAGQMTSANAKPVCCNIDPSRSRKHRANRLSQVHFRPLRLTEKPRQQPSIQCRN
jgi:hypothetical protein